MNFKTKHFKTRTQFIQQQNLAPETSYPVALDIGYSAVKGFSPNGVYCFPSFIKEMSSKTIIGQAQPDDIFYKDEKGKEYAIGEMAIKATSYQDTNESVNTLYDRQRYFTTMFLILARVGIAAGMKKNIFGGYTTEKKLVVQTGLPPAYKKADTPLLIEALTGYHRFSVKFGDSKWEEFTFHLSEYNISVIDQPIGSVYSASKKSNGETVYADNGKSYIDSKLFVIDGGFGTFDTFGVSNRSITCTDTFTEFGAKNILQRTCDDIMDIYNKEIPVHTLQPFLETGTVVAYDRKTKSATSKDFSELLRNNSQKCFEKCFDKIDAINNGLVDYDYLLVTGGTGAAWLDYIKDRYKNMETLKIITGNQNEKLSHIYSNVRGYYIYRALICMQK